MQLRCKKCGLEFSLDDPDLEVLSDDIIVCPHCGSEVKIQECTIEEEIEEQDWEEFFEPELIEDENL